MISDQNMEGCCCCSFFFFFVFIVCLFVWGALSLRIFHVNAIYTWTGFLVAAAAPVVYVVVVVALLLLCLIFVCFCISVGSSLLWFLQSSAGDRLMWREAMGPDRVKVKTSCCSAFVCVLSRWAFVVDVAVIVVLLLVLLLLLFTEASLFNSWHTSAQQLRQCEWREDQLES